MSRKRESSIRIAGSIADLRTQRGIPGLHIEAWDKDFLVPDLVGSAISNVDGTFEMIFDASYFSELFLDREPDLFFRVYRGDELLASTEDSVLWNIHSGDREVVIEVDLGEEEEEGLPETPTTQTLKVSGQLVQPDGSAIAKAVVKAFDADLRRESLLGEAVTSEDGTYSIQYTANRLSRPDKLQADLIVRAFSDEGDELASSPFICAAGANETVTLVMANAPLIGPSEYTQLYRKLDPYLGMVALADLDRSDVDYLVQCADFDRVQLATLIVANRLTNETGISDWFFYALGRQGVRLQLAVLPTYSLNDLRLRAERAIELNVVPQTEDGTVEAPLAQLQAVLTALVLGEETGSEGSLLREVLMTSLIGRWYGEIISNQ